MISLTEKINLYKKISKTDDHDNRASSLYDEIEKDLLVICYYYPQVRFGLSENDAADFVLFIKTQINIIIERFIENSEDFMAYFSAVIKFRLKAFYNQRDKKRFDELAVLNGHSGYEYQLSEEINDFKTAAEEKEYEDCSELTEMLRYLCFKSPLVRKRLFLFLASIAPEIDMRTLETICNSLKYDYMETERIISFIADKCTNIKEEIDELIQKRNNYYCKTLSLELELLSGRADRETVFSKMDYNRQCQQAKSYQLEIKTKTVPYQILMEVFNLKRGTIGSYLFLSRNLLDWCNNLEETGGFSTSETGISQNLILEAAIMKKYEKEKVSLPIFHPFEEFEINLKLHENDE